jgi:hypothetical protein
MILSAIAVIYGLMAALAFRLLTNPRLRDATNQLTAHILEFRLFIDEPALIWKAQREAFRANFAILRQIALPTILMAILFAAVWQPMQSRFGHAPLALGQTTVMTAHTDPVPCFSGLLIESPGVHIPATGETVWRVRLVRPLKAALPPGVELRYPPSNAWLYWFFALSTLTALAAANSPKAFRRAR